MILCEWMCLIYYPRLDSELNVFPMHSVSEMIHGQFHISTRRCQKHCLFNNRWRRYFLWWVVCLMDYDYVFLSNLIPFYFFLRSRAYHHTLRLKPFLYTICFRIHVSFEFLWSWVWTPHVSWLRQTQDVNKRREPSLLRTWAPKHSSKIDTSLTAGDVSL